jgi:hypothetical protein
MNKEALENEGFIDVDESLVASLVRVCEEVRLAARELTENGD